MSRKPRVVIIPTRAPARSITMFVATVVPWKTASTSPGATPASSQTFKMPLTTPSDWSCGVLETLVYDDLLRAVAPRLFKQNVGEGAPDINADPDHRSLRPRKCAPVADPDVDEPGDAVAAGT